MHILLLTKRQYTGKDVIDDEFGRLYELPKNLAQIGHRISGVCLAYHRTQKKLSWKPVRKDKVSWHLFYLWPFPPIAALIYLYRVNQLIKNDKPNLLLASSDIFHAILGKWLANRHGIPYALDLYDQYETFGASKLPGLKSAFRQTLAKADVIICSSKRLKKWVKTISPQDQPILVLGNAISRDKFFPRIKIECRKQLNLPIDGCKLIGTAGTLDATRDINLLYSAFLKIAAQQNDIHLVIAGPRDIQPPEHPRIHDLGIIKHSDVALLFSALDLGIVCNADNSFSYYCCPQKLIEMQACGLPAISSDVIERKADEKRLTYQAGNHSDMATCILRVLDSHDTYKTTARSITPLALTWENQAKKLSRFLEQITY